MITEKAAELAALVLLMLCVVLAIALGAQTLRLADERAAHAVTKQEQSIREAVMQRHARAQVDAARAEEQRRVAALQEVIDEAEKSRDLARADAVAAADVGRRLRAQLGAAAAARYCPAGNPAATGAGPPAEAPPDLLADVQRRLDEAADGIARFADEAAGAGAACEASYRTLKP